MVLERRCVCRYSSCLPLATTTGSAAPYRVGGGVAAQPVRTTGGWGLLLVVATPGLTTARGGLHGEQAAGSTTSTRVTGRNTTTATCFGEERRSGTHGSSWCYYSSSRSCLVVRTPRCSTWVTTATAALLVLLASFWLSAQRMLSDCWLPAAFEAAN